MLHCMKLNTEPFLNIENGTKTIELRLNDEKRRKLSEGDFIEFTMTTNPERKLLAVVERLHVFESFDELYSKIPLEKCGYTKDNVSEASASDMEKYYSKQEQLQYGVVGIELRATVLYKFVDAQNNGYSFGSDYATALSEIRNGEKISHWMWYVFPQIKGLGLYEMSAYFSINDIHEARDYINHPLLGARLVEISNVLLTLDTDDPMVVFGDPDAFKLRSSMTLFREAKPEEPVFQRVLDKYCHGIPDDRTLEILEAQKSDADIND